MVCIKAYREGSDKKQVKESNSAAAPKPQQRNLVDVLLGNAASNLDRGTCTCARCKGAGACSCSACKGSGVVEEGHGTARMNAVRHAVSQVSSLLGAKHSPGQEWMQTNRCRLCHGSGQVRCVPCRGTGYRFKGCELPAKE